MKRREFVRNTALAGALGASLPIVYSHLAPKGYSFLAEQDTDPYALFNKDKEMRVLNDKPWNMEAAAHLLDDPVTPNKFMFIRNNGLIPESIDVANWVLTIDGESVRETTRFSLNDIKTKFPKYTYQLTLECGGNGRSEFDPPAKGNQWTVGAVSCAQWAGARLRDVLEAAGIKGDAVYVAYHGADVHLSRDPGKEPISRGVPLAKALQDETLLAYEMNGEDIPLAHGYPLRMVAGGWPASVSGKWVNRISIRDRVHDGPKMGGTSYRVPCAPVAPGEKVADEDMCIIESMPVKSLITSPKTGARFSRNKVLEIRGHTWAGELEVAKMEYSIDFGTTWKNCSVQPPVNRLAWQRFTASIRFPEAGYYEIWARATDSEGKSQPMVLPGWNPKGYLNNACHRIAVKVT